jgi:hypothetical protein
MQSHSLLTCSLDAKGHCYAEPVDQGFVLCTIIGGFVVDLQEVLALLSPKRDE